jgi:hypothetical protein
MKALPTDAGCWIDGHWGQYGPARLVSIAVVYGYDDDRVVSIARRHLDECSHPGVDNEITDDDFDQLSGAIDEVESWLNANVAPEGFSFGWHDGEFYLWSTETWEEEK